MITFAAAFPQLRRELRRLQQLKPSKQRRILKSSFNSSTGPIKTKLRQIIRREANRTGTLAKAIQSKSGVSGGGADRIAAYVLVGARSRRKQITDPETGTPKTVNPANYLHLADLGTQPHHQPDGYRFRNVNGRRVLYKSPFGTQHPGARGKGMMERAARVIGPKTQERFSRQFEKRLEKCLR